MLIKKGLWEGPFIELQRSLFGPRGGAGLVRMWRCPACGTHYYHAKRYWESQEKELAPERVEHVEGEVLILPTRGGHGLRSASGKHYLTPHVFSFKVVEYLQFVPAAFSKAVLCNNEIATFKHPHCAYEQTLVACEMKQLDVPQRVCSRCYATMLIKDPNSAEVRYFHFRATETPRIYSHTQPGVIEVSMKEEPLYYFDEIKPAGVRALVRRYRWGVLGVLISEEGHVEVRYEREKATFNAKFVEFVRV